MKYTLEVFWGSAYGNMVRILLHHESHLAPLADQAQVDFFLFKRKEQVFSRSFKRIHTNHLRFGLLVSFQKLDQLFGLKNFCEDIEQVLFVLVILTKILNQLCFE